MTADERFQPPRLRSRRGGFTLIEVMIAVAIVAILAAVALPGYQSYIRKTNRAAATSMLQAAALAQERHRLGATTYATAATALNPPCPTSGSCMSDRQHYELETPIVATATGFTLNAVAKSAIQTADTGCTTISLSVAGGTVTHSPPKCWGN